jgi:hypothetical protein
MLPDRANMTAGHEDISAGAWRAYCVGFPRGEVGVAGEASASALVSECRGQTKEAAPSATGPAVFS